MKLPRKGVLIRIVIYGGLFGYLGYAAIMRCQAERELESGTIQDQLEAQEGKPTRMVTLPDGTQMPVYEITQEEYDAMFDKPPGTDASSETPTPIPTPPNPPPSAAEADTSVGGDTDSAGVAGTDEAETESNDDSAEK